jgi:flagellar protein FliS
MNIQQSYREAAVQGASPVQLVVRLYEQLIEDLRQAAIAIEHNAIERRTRRINHAILVIGHLQSPLNFAGGGKVARDLNYFYDILRQSVVRVQFQPSKRALAQLITDVLLVREAWIEVERAEKASITAPATMLLSASADTECDPLRVDWKG